ncbi:MAG: hypothetical protein ACHQ7N_06900 [Candidatus Methylomirabilales bacterium]
MRDAANEGAVRRRLVVVLVLLVMPTLALGQAQEIHGENSLFAGHGVAIAWGVLKGATEEQTQVILRIEPTGAVYAVVRIEGVDPFTQNRQVIIDGEPLHEHLDVRTPRGTFADFPRREIHLYRTDADWQAHKPSLTIFYLGLPDTTPEFTSEVALFAYLDDSLAKVQGTGEGRKP